MRDDGGEPQQHPAQTEQSSKQRWGVDYSHPSSGLDDRVLDCNGDGLDKEEIKGSPENIEANHEVTTGVNEGRNGEANEELGYRGGLGSWLET
jgi:hypothetical protein